MRRFLVAALALVGSACLSQRTVQATASPTVDTRSDSERARNGQAEAAKVSALTRADLARDQARSDSLAKGPKKAPPI
jgi:hypothetical protein